MPDFEEENFGLLAALIKAKYIAHGFTFSEHSY
jgi:hypothetical protein